MIDLQKEIKLAKQRDLTYQVSEIDLKTTKEIVGEIERSKPLVEVIFYLGDKTFGDK